MFALAASTAELQQTNQRWSAPPGTRMVDYAIEQAGARVSAPGLSRTTRPTVARFAVASAVPPHITDAMSVADRLHRTLVSYSATPVFTGCEPDSTTPLTGNDHAYVLPEVDARRSERIRFLTVIADMGFDEGEVQALQRVTRLWGRDGHDLQLVYLGVGSPEDFAGPRAEAGHSTILSSARTWRSLTPFVATRHTKKKRSGEPRVDEHGDVIGSPRHDMIRLLAEKGFPRPSRVKDLGRAYVAGKSMPWSRWKTERAAGSGKRSVAVGTGFEITFDSPVTGPIAVGYGAHFGLGLFAPVESIDSEE